MKLTPAQIENPLFCKMHDREGKTLFIVDLWPFNTELDSLKYNEYFITFFFNLTKLSMQRIFLKTAKSTLVIFSTCLAFFHAPLSKVPQARGL